MGVGVSAHKKPSTEQKFATAQLDTQKQILAVHIQQPPHRHQEKHVISAKVASSFNLPALRLQVQNAKT
jgi:hypothetical protein